MHPDMERIIKERPRWNATIKIVVGVIIIVLIALGLYQFRVAIGPLVIGAIMAYIFQPLVTWLQKNLRLPRGLAAGMLYLALLGTLAPIVVTLTPILIEQALFLRDEAVDFIGYLETISPDETVEIMGLEFGVQGLVDEVTAALTNGIREFAPESITFVFDAFETVLMVIFTLLIGFYLTSDAPRFIDWFKGLVPPGYGDDATRLLEEINRIWTAFFRGQAILALTVGTLMVIVCSIIGMPNPILMGILAGMLEFLPSIGHAIWLVVALIVALLEGSTVIPVSNIAFALIVAGVQVGYTQFDLNFLIPRIIGRGVHLHPMVVIIGIIIGASVGGVLGVALAAPVIATLRVFGRYIYAMLFDLDPFPMVGPPSAPRIVRETQLEKMAELAPPPLSDTAVMRRIRELRMAVGENADGDEASDERVESQE